jgi:hypothetical protein
MFHGHINLKAASSPFVALCKNSTAWSSESQHAVELIVEQIEKDGLSSAPMRKAPASSHPNVTKLNGSTPFIRWPTVNGAAREPNIIVPANKRTASEYLVV